MIQTAGSTTESESSSTVFRHRVPRCQDAATSTSALTLVSPDEDLLAYSVDTDGDEVFELRFRDLRTGRTCRTPWPAATTAARGAPTRSGSSTPCTTRRTGPGRCCGTGSAPTRPTTWSCSRSTTQRFELNLRATRSGRLIVIWSESRSTSEAWVLDAAAPESAPRSVGGRRHGVALPRRARAVPRGRPAARGDQRRGGRVPADDGPVPLRRRPGPVGLGARRGPSAPDERLLAGRRVRRGRRALLPVRRRAPAAGRRGTTTWPATGAC